MSNAGTVYIVDNDDAVRKGLRILFSSMDLAVEDFPGVRQFLKAYVSGGPACLILDLRMPGKGGMELLLELVERDLPLPVIMLSGHGDIPIAVKAIHYGALDFVPKPGHEQTLLDQVQEALQANVDCLDFRRERAEVEEQFSKLSAREGEIVRLVASGHLNKEIGLDLGISERTVEAHRLHALRKLNVRAGADLNRLVNLLTPEACPHKTRKWCPKCRAQA